MYKNLVFKRAWMLYITYKRHKGYEDVNFGQCLKDAHKTIKIMVSNNLLQLLSLLYQNETITI